MKTASFFYIDCVKKAFGLLTVQLNKNLLVIKIHSSIII
jgi:hypothetical protein